MKQLDPKLAKLGNALWKATPAERDKLASAFAEQLRTASLSGPARTALTATLEILRRGQLRAAGDQAGPLAELIAALLSVRFPDVASHLFSVASPGLQTLPETDLARILPSVRSADVWVQTAALDRKALLSRVLKEPGRYYDSVLIEWAVKLTPAARLLPVARLALPEPERPAHLPTSRDVLVAIVAKDRQAVLARPLLAEAGESEPALNTLLRAIGKARASWEPWSRAVGLAAARRAAGFESPVLRSVTAMMGAGDDDLAAFASLFAAHVATTVATAASGRGRTDCPAPARALIAGASVSSRSRGDDAIWLAGPVKLVAEVVSQGNANVTLQGARQLAQGLRALSSNPDCRAVFVAVAENLGLSPIGDPEVKVVFDPRLHQDLTGGILPGTQVTVADAGWSFGNDVVLRATVRSG